jgi:AAA domain-containing protein
MTAPYYDRAADHMNGAEAQCRLTAYVRAIASAPPDQQLGVLSMAAEAMVELIENDEIDQGDVVDRLQGAAEAYKVVYNHGQDAVQKALADAFHSNGDERDRTGTSKPLYGPDGPNAYIYEPAPVNLIEYATVVRVADVPAIPIRWLWYPRFAYGKFSLIAGDPGLGKGLFSHFVTSILTRGGKWPGCSAALKPANVIVLSAEEDVGDMIRPRLEAAGADVRLVHVIKSVKREDGKGQRGFNLIADVDKLGRVIADVGNVGLVVIDPVSAYLGAMSGHSNTEVRAALSPLQALASERGVAVLAISHLNKGNSGTGTAMHRVTGSGAFVAAARASFLVIREPETERRLLLPLKNNLGDDKSGLAFTVEERDTPSGIRAPAVRLSDDPVTMTADEALSAISETADEHGALADAKEFLLDLLTAGPVAAKDMERLARDAGIAKRTLDRAKGVLGVKSTRIGELGQGGKWVWALPSDGDPVLSKNAKNPYVCQPSEMAHLANSGTLSGDGGE